MVSTRQRGKAAAAFGLAAASLCSKHGGADAFYAGSSGSGTSFAFAPAHAQPRWLAGHPSASASPSSTAGRVHRLYVRDRDGVGFESGQQRWRRPAGISVSRAAARGGAFGSGRGSSLRMASSEDGAEVSASPVSVRAPDGLGVVEDCRA